MNKLSVVFTLITFTLSAIGADKVKVACDTIYVAPLTETPAEARYKAIEMAKTAALEAQFGTIIRAQDLIITTDRGQQAMSLGEFDVNGTWLSDIHDPEFKMVEQRATEIVYSIRVAGWARQIQSDHIDIDCRLLNNGCDKNRDKLKDNTYYSGDEMFLYFNSPVNGWIAVYLGDDDEAQTMQCLLPYDRQTIGAYPIKANKEYLFFSKEHAEPESVDYAAGLVMESRKATDFNVLYVIFSTKKFSGTASVENQTLEYTTQTSDELINLMPRETDFKSFQKWLGKKRLSDPNMQVIKTLLAIKR
ncbi:MAG: DUF4384 domain-containing protein [Bacteroides sp.]|nr:DUF4384 domain-containing protein [Bacteroides sp.]